MIILINGTYGIGKTTIATQLQKSFSEYQFELFDSDLYYQKMLQNDPLWFIGGTSPQNNIKFLKNFRTMIEEKSKNENHMILIVMSITKKECKEELFDYLNKKRKILHIILTANYETIKNRILHDIKRDKHFSLEYIEENIEFLYNNFNDAIYINTDNKDINTIVQEIIALI